MGLQFGAAVIVIALMTILHVDEAGSIDIVPAPGSVDELTLHRRLTAS